MSYSYLGGQLNIFRSKIDICVVAFHELVSFQKLNPNIFLLKIDFSCSTAGCQGVAAGDRQKITKMTIESSGMVGFHFFKKENKV